MTINTYIIKRNRYIGFVLSYVTVIGILTAILTVTTHSEAVIIVGMFLIISPGIFSSLFQKRFVQKTIILLTGDYFSLTILEQEPAIFYFNEIASISATESIKDDSLLLGISLRNSVSSKKYTIIKQSKNELKRSVADVLVDYVESYNAKALLHE